MMLITTFIASLFTLFATPDTEEHSPFARIETSMGDIYIELFQDEAPVSCANFLNYATDGFYDRLVFHRVIPGTLIQGGGYNKRLYPRATRDPIPNEATNGLKNDRGTIAMARHDDPDSATSQFFINLGDNDFLNRTGDEYKKDAGYAVFGKVIIGMDVADAIGSVSTSDGEGYDYFPSEVPVDPVLILRIDPVSASDIEEKRQ